MTVPSKDELLAKVAELQEKAGLCPSCQNRRYVTDEETGLLKPCADCGTE